MGVRRPRECFDHLSGADVGNCFGDRPLAADDERPAVELGVPSVAKDQVSRELPTVPNAIVPPAVAGVLVVAGSGIPDPSTQSPKMRRQPGDSARWPRWQARAWRDRRTTDFNGQRRSV